MSENKKYSAKEAATAVLKKAEELLKKAEVLKKVAGKESKHDRCVEHVKENSPEVKNPHAVCVAQGVKPASWSKSEQDVTPPDEVQEQIAPESNPKEQAEGNNAPWGSSPGTKGHLKLAKFIGYAQAKRKKPSEGIGNV